jgi:hypothetical protein
VNDNDVISEFRARFDEVHMTTPVETVIARGRALRRRRRFTAHPASAVAFTINPAAIPAGAGGWIEVTPETSRSSGTVTSYSFGMRAMQIYVSGHCPAQGGQ